MRLYKGLFLYNTLYIGAPIPIIKNITINEKKRQSPRYKFFPRQASL